MTEAGSRYQLGSYPKSSLADLFPKAQFVTPFDPPHPAPHPNPPPQGGRGKRGERGFVKMSAAELVKRVIQDLAICCAV